MQTIQTRILDSVDVDIVRTAVSKANRKAAKIGVTGFTYSLLPAAPREITVPDLFHQGSYKVIGYVEQTEVVVIGEAPKYAGWTFAATLNWDAVSKVCVVCKLDGLDVDLSAVARPEIEWCDYCNSRRLRSNTYLLLHEDGSFKQVGSTCLQEFLGVNVNLSLLGFNPYENVEDNSPRRPDRLLSTVAFTDILALTRAYGWVSANSAYQSGKTSTKQRYSEALWDTRKGGSGEEYRRAIQQFGRDDDTVTAEVILNWVRTELDASSEYVQNLIAALAADDDTFNVTNLGLVVSAPYAYQRDQERKAQQATERAQSAGSEFVGQVKDRLCDLVVTVVTTRYIESDWGSSTLLVLRDADGNSYKWFASNFDADQGDVLTLDGTVKKHEVYNDLKSTVLTRCIVKEVVATT